MSKANSCSCAACGNNGDNLKTCNGCKLAKYCSRDCQVRDWTENGHSFLCSSNVEVRTCDGGKGAGVFAVRDIAVGGEVHREKPLVLFSDARGRVEQNLTPKNSKFVWTLHDAHQFRGVTSIDGIAKTNSLPAADAHGLFLLACRLNHACNGSQNARYLWRGDLRKMMVYAIRPIRKGDEVLVNYIDKYLPREERQKQLSDGFRFECACAECTTKWSKARDDTLEEIRESIDISGYIRVAEREPKRALMLVEQLLETLEREDLNTPMDRGTIHYDAVQIATRASDIAKVRYHLKKAHECWLQSEGEGSQYDLMGRDMMAKFGVRS